MENDNTPLTPKEEEEMLRDIAEGLKDKLTGTGIGEVVLATWHGTLGSDSKASSLQSAASALLTRS